MGKIAGAIDLYAIGVTVIPLIIRGFKDSEFEAGTSVTREQSVVNH